MKRIASGMNLHKGDHMDIVSFLIGLMKGKKEGEKTIVLGTDGYQITDPNNDGNLVITQGDES